MNAIPTISGRRVLGQTIKIYWKHFSSAVNLFVDPTQVPRLVKSLYFRQVEQHVIFILGDLGRINNIQYTQNIWRSQFQSASYSYFTLLAPKVLLEDLAYDNPQSHPIHKSSLII